MTDEIPEGYVKVGMENSGVKTIEFSHPGSNALPAAILNTLSQEIYSAGIETDTKVIVLRSAGTGAFCAGASFTELTAVTTAEEGKKFFSGFAHVINAMRKCPKLIIARVQGKCVGGGVGLAAAADYAIAAEGADIKLSELTMGLGPFVVGPAIQRKIGLSAFSQLAIAATVWQPAEWAREKGLYAELHLSVNDMDKSIHQLTHELAHSHPEAIAELKKMLWEGTENWDDLLLQRAATSGKLVISSFTKKALEKFRK